ncbi:MAG: site-specific integrase [Deltaproteobacteria bacterium]|uniref:Site-specific integrase n=1 Tax=Candidatus Desulfacyla euxinica TaxID=2841693 RepID=A0A8J6T7N5_9DELT|nr:site-specific integrase [Candidatus Desulfacyla euxinica]
MSKWIRSDYPGVRYRKHKTRKHGIKFDQYFAIYYQFNGKRKEEGLGWASKGWTAKKANLVLAGLKQAQTTGEGETTLKERRDAKRKRTELKALKKKQAITFGEYFKNAYFPLQNTKGERTVAQEDAHFRNWLSPVLKDVPLKDIRPLHLERVKKNMLDAGRAPRMLQYVFATFRQIWNQGRRDGLVNKNSPSKQVKLPRIDNKRTRFLTYEEADLLLEDLSVRSQQLHDISLLSLHTGMRAGEIFSLTWNDVHTDRGTIDILDAKGGDRTAFMTNKVRAMFERLPHGRPREFVFKDRNRKQIKEVSNAFNRAVKDLGFNDGIVDRRQKLIFHSLRHSFASWLVSEGEDLYRVQKLMGHASLAMVQRYAHLAPDSLKGSIKRFEKKLNERKQTVKIVPMKKEAED